MRTIHNILLSIAAAVHFSACGQSSFDQQMKLLYKNTVPLIRPSELKQSPEENLFILDTRSPEEYRVSHLEGARHVGYEHFDTASITDIPKDAEVVVYCSVGYRSERIGEKLQDIGYENVSNLHGGIFGWKNQGYQVVNINNQPTDSVHAYNRVWGQWLKNGIKVYE